jgi:hypothetical protein
MCSSGIAPRELAKAYLRMYTSPMHRVRRAAGSIAMAWLLCQTATIVLATAAFGFEAVAVKLLECTCAHGSEHSDCPMHHPSNSSRQGNQLQQCGNRTDTALLGSLMGQLGLVPAAASAAPSIPPRTYVPIDVRTFVLRPPPPDPPPPRA